MNKRSYFYLLLFIATLLYQGFVNFNPQLRFYFFQKVIFIGLSLLWFSLMIYYLINKEDNLDKKKRIMNKYVLGITILYGGNLIYLLFLDHDFGRCIDINQSKQLAHLIEGINLEPFKMVKNYYIAYIHGNIELSNVMLNVFGNLILFAPMGVLLPTLFNKLRQFWLFFIVMVVMVVVSECSQVYFQVGIGDIDDVILNLIGAVFMFLFFRIPVISRKWLQFLCRE